MIKLAGRGNAVYELSSDGVNLGKALVIYGLDVPKSEWWAAYRSVFYLVLHWWVSRGWWFLNLLRTGDYRRSNGYIYEYAKYGRWWSAVTGSTTYGRSLDTYPPYVYSQGNAYRGYGIAVRCVVREGYEGKDQLFPYGQLFSFRWLYVRTCYIRPLVVNCSWVCYGRLLFRYVSYICHPSE